jgi:hypothetical protein
MASPRLIDKLPSVSPPHIEILVLGMSRTGTMSMKVALDQLGYRTLHASNVHTTPGGWLYWNEAIDAKFYGKGKPYAKPEFDKLLKKYTAISDMPAILFVDELLAAYPDAKVILTNRNVDDWISSMNKSVYVVLEDWLNRFHENFQPHGFGACFVCIRRVVTIWASGDMEDRAKLRQGYLNHYAHVRHVVPKQRLLEFESKDGWEPLCKFLGKDIPATPYPRVNDADATVKYLRKVSRANLATLMAKGMTVALAGAVVGGIWWYQPYARL